MKLTIKNLKTAKFASEETLCYEATIYIDGVRACTAHNQGYGGPDDYRAVSKQGQEMMDKFEAWCKAHPSIVTQYSSADSAGAFQYQPDMEHFVQEAITNFEIEKDIKKHIKTKLVGFMDGKIYTWNIPPTHPTGREIVLKKNPTVQFVNDMPMEEAIQAYRVGGA